MSKFNATIMVDAGDSTKAIFDSINTDNEFYPENPTRTRMSLGRTIKILVESDNLPHLRANLNSTLRLVHASYDSIESTKKS